MCRLIWRCLCPSLFERACARGESEKKKQAQVGGGSEWESIDKDGRVYVYLAAVRIGRLNVSGYDIAQAQDIARRGRGGMYLGVGRL